MKDYERYGTTNPSCTNEQNHVALHNIVRLSPYIVVVLVLLILPGVVPTYIQTLLTKFLIFAILALSLNLIWGYTGLLSLGHATYFGVGAYTTAILVTKYGVESFWLNALGGIAFAVLLAAIFGVLALRMSGVYFLLVTLAMAQLVYYVIYTWEPMTGAFNGIAGIPLPNIGIPDFKWTSTSYYFFTLLFAVICYFVMYRIVQSPYGHALQGIRENEPRMRVLGYNTWAYKYTAFIIGGLFAGVSGVLFCYFLRMLAPTHASIAMSTMALLMVIIGGTKVFYGPVIGALLIVFLEFYASTYVPQRWPIIFGGILVVGVMFLRGGIGFHLHRLWRRVFKNSLEWKY